MDKMTDEERAEMHEMEKDSMPEKPKEEKIMTMKELYEKEPDKWVVFHREPTQIKWFKSAPKWCSDYEYKLILKKDEIIADAVIANSDVEVNVYHNRDLVGFLETLKGMDFFKHYDKDVYYKLRNEPTQINSMEDLNELLIVGEEDGMVSNMCGDNNSKLGVESLEVLSIKDEQGKEYKFEKPEESNNDTYKLFFMDAAGDIFGLINEIAYMWEADGKCFYIGSGTGGDKNEREKMHDLTPIKPKWYEDESNFPTVLILEKTEAIIICRTKEFYLDDYIRISRLATKKEVMSLYYDGKE